MSFIDSNPPPQPEDQHKENYVIYMPTKYIPFNHIIQLDYSPATKIGEIHLPQGMKKVAGFEFVRCTVLAVGPECKQVKVGDVVVLPTAMMQKCEDAWFTGEDKIMAICVD